MTHPSASTQALDLSLFAGLPVPVISDCMDRLAGTCALLPRHGSAPLLGRARTVRVRAGDNLYIHALLRQVGPDDVIVVDAGGGAERAVIGEIMMRVAQARGVAGYVIDGAIRDVSAFREAGYPCFARAVTHRGPYKNGPGEIACPVVIDGCVVHEGDYVIGDEDGVVFVRPEQAAQVAAAARRKHQDETEMMQSIADNRYDDRWLDAALAHIVAK